MDIIKILELICVLLCLLDVNAKSRFHITANGLNFWILEGFKFSGTKFYYKGDRRTCEYILYF